MQETGVKVACTLLPYIDFKYGVLPLREEGRITRLRRGVVCSEVAAREEGAAGTNPSRLEKQGSQKVSKNFLIFPFIR